MSQAATIAHPVLAGAGGTSMLRRLTSALPTWDLIRTRNLELRRRRGLMIAVLVLVLAPPVLVLGLRLLFHAIDPSKYSPAGNPSLFSGIVNPMSEFGFIIAATLGAAAGTTDLSDGVFRHLVATGRSRVALFLARIPAGLGIIVPVVALGFTMLCLVTCYAGVPNPTSVSVNGYSVPAHLDEAQLQHWIRQHPQEANMAFYNNRIIINGAPSNGGSPYSLYLASEVGQFNPPINEMVKVGLWLELVIVVAFTAGLGLGALTGQRTVSTILMIALEIIITPIFAAHVIPYFINGQRLIVGLPLDQLRPFGLASGANGGGGGPGHIIFGGRGALDIPPMPTWGMIAVIVGWVVGWSIIGAWRMATRDA